jgi:aspartate oxidase
MVLRLPRRHVPCAELPPRSLQNLQNVMWRNVGLVRNGQDMLWAARVLALWGRFPRNGKDRAAHELANLTLVGRLVVEGALARKESRGAHYRTDFPEPKDEWDLHTVFQGEER